jgi:hypothetical protein
MNARCAKGKLPPQPRHPRRRSITAIVLLAALAVWPESGSPQTTPAMTAGTNNPANAFAAGDAKTARQRLMELRETFSTMLVGPAVLFIRQYLDSKSDAPTHLGFKLAADGSLDEAPTLRTFLLDELTRLNPASAADYATVVLAGMDSADEWAVALRSLALGDASITARTLLRQKTAAMLQYTPWQQNPSTGFLEAFDVAVYLGGTNLLPTLSSLLRQQDNPAVAHAAYLALDRLVISDPAPVLNALAAAPDLLQGRELTRANYFARADVRDPQQRQTLEIYLLDPRIGGAEIAAFAGVYPNVNFMISHNLLTQTPTPGRAALASRDAASLTVANQWLSDPRFANLKPELQIITARLQLFVQQENQAP